MRAVAFILFLFTAAAAAQPLPARPTVVYAFENREISLRVVQDRCFVWSAPLVEFPGPPAEVAVTQDVSAGPCPQPSSITPFAWFRLGPLPVGTYKLSYRIRATGFTAPPPEIVTFVVRPAAARDLAIDPVDPLALEPVAISFYRNVCESIRRVELVDGGVRVVVDNDDSNPIACDYDTAVEAALGAFPPGSYSVVLQRPPEQGGAVLGSASFVARPGPAAVSDVDALPRTDRSGLWYSPQAAPNTGLEIVHSVAEASGAGTPATSSMTMFWYLYDENGDPVWYVITARAEVNSSRYLGEVLRFDRTGAGTPQSNVVGSAELRFGFLEQTGRVIASVGQRSFDFAIEPLRWQRSAWPGPPPASAAAAPASTKGGFIEFDPPAPVALEPVQVTYFATSCDTVERVESVAGGLRIVRGRNGLDPFVCDNLVPHRFTLAAFPPGSFDISYVWTDDPTGQYTQTETLTVLPGRPAIGTNNPQPGSDWSGPWSGRQDAPGTGLSVVHSRDVPGEGNDLLTAVWYLYGEAGEPTWRVIDARRQGEPYVGDVLRFARAGGGVPEASAVGRATLYMDNLEQPAQLDATVGGRSFDARFDRLRWRRSAWPAPVPD